MGRREKAVPVGDVAAELGATLRRARHERGLTLSALAQTLQYTKGHLSAVETGAVAPSRDLLRAYEAALGLPDGDLVAAADRLGPAGRRRSLGGTRGPSGRGAAGGTLTAIAPEPEVADESTTAAGLDRAIRQVAALIDDAGRRVEGDEEITVTLQIRKGMAAGPADHKAVIRREVTRQAAAYAGNPAIADPERIARLVEAVAPPRDARVLDVAAGPGFVALGFAAVCREVVGLDLTAAPLAIAESARRERHLTNLRFECGDAEDLPFDDGAFDAVVCRFTFHHLEDPARALSEMARVCRVGGTVAVEDLIASEYPERAAYHNRVEQLRDPSHVRALPLSELIALFTDHGLDVQTVLTDALVPSVDRWLADAQTPPDRAAEARSLLARDERADLSGVRPFRREDGLAFTQRTGLVTGRKLAGR